MAHDPKLVQDLFLRLIEMPAEDRESALDRECGDDAELRARVLELLKAHEEPDSFLDPPHDEIDATMIPPSGTSGGEKDLDMPQTGEYELGRDPRTDEVIAGRYELKEKIGEGGMGEVWVARQSEPVKRKVALKLIKLGMDSKAVLNRFEQERQALGMMDHPNIARVLDGGITAMGQPFFVMELVNGLALDRFCDEATLSLNERLELFVPICQAVQHAHQKGIVHRDLKPSNILVTMIDGRPTPKIIDFGVAKATSGKLTDEAVSTQFGAIVGTLEYMSPEQAGYSGDDIDTRSDIYSLGVILYELLTGLRPIDAERLKQAAFTEMIRIIREEEPSKPSTRLSTDKSLPSLAAVRRIEPAKLTALLRGELDWIVMKCLEKRRDRRYETANGLLRDIQRFLADEPVEARPPSASYRFGKFLKRNKGPVLAVSLVLFVLIGGIIGTSLGWIEAKRQEGYAKEQAESERLAKQEAESRRAEAEDQRNRADRERLIALAVRDFLNNKLLGQADVTAQADALIKAGQLASLAKANPTVRELLDRAAEELSEEKIEESFPGRPLVQAEILYTVGRAYLGIGDPRRAVEFLERAWELQKKAKVGTITTRNSLGQAYLEVSSVDDALRFAEETLELAKAELTENDPLRLNCMRTLSEAYVNAMKIPQALQLAKDAFEFSKKSLGVDDPETLRSMEALAWVYQSSDTPGEAVPLAKKLLDLSKENKRLGEDHPETIGRIYCLARAYEEIGKRELVLPLVKKAFDLTEGKFGPDHPDTLIRKVQLANEYNKLANLKEGVPHLVEALEITRTKLGTDDPAAPRILNRIATAYNLIDRPAEALPLVVQALDLAKARLGLEDPQTHVIMNNLAMTYQNQRKPADAIPLLEEVRRLREPLVGPDHRSMIPILNNLGRAYAQTRNLDKAIPLYEEAIKISKTKLGPGHPDTIGSLTNFAVVLWILRGPDEAIPLLKEAHAIASRIPDSPHENFMLEELVTAHKEAGKPEGAVPYLKELIEHETAVAGPNGAGVLFWANDLAQTYVAIGQLEEAVPLFARISAANPKDTALMVKLAVFQAWLGQDEELAATIERALRFAKDTKDPAIAQRTARACNLRPSENPAQLEVSLNLARTAVEGAKPGKPQELAQLALGMAEYRSGNFPAAEKTLASLAEGNKNNHAAAFFRAMSLFQSGKKDEARQLAMSAAKKIKPLPENEKALTAGKTLVEDLTLWLAYKEAQALIQFPVIVKPAIAEK